jgi:hypothetical protein
VLDAIAHSSRQKKNIKKYEKKNTCQGGPRFYP